MNEPIHPSIHPSCCHRQVCADDSQKGVQGGKMRRILDVFHSGSSWRNHGRNWRSGTYCTTSLCGRRTPNSRYIHILYVHAFACVLIYLSICLSGYLLLPNNLPTYLPSYLRTIGQWRGGFSPQESRPDCSLAKE